MAPQLPSIILYIYTFSPYGRKVTQYLTLRGIPYATVEQPPVMPRPDIELIGVKYRRIPIMSIGRDIYCDTLLILQKLDELFPGNTLGATTGKDKALQDLLEKWSSDVVFQRCIGTLPPDFPAMNDEAFIKDRTDLWGGEWGKAQQEKVRPNALKEARGWFDFLENLMGAEGQEWALGSHGPTAADLHGLWLFDWLLELCPGSLPEDEFSPKTYPKTFAWRERYRNALEAARQKMPEPEVLEGPAAAEKVLGAGFAEQEGDIDPSDSIVRAAGLKKGSQVEVWPTDTTVKKEHYEKGELVSLNRQEAVLKVISKDGVDIRVHTPRWNFSLRPVDAVNGT